MIHLWIYAVHSGLKSLLANLGLVLNHPTIQEIRGILKVGTWWFVAGSTHSWRLVTSRPNKPLIGRDFYDFNNQESITDNCYVSNGWWSRNAWPFQQSRNWLSNIYIHISMAFADRKVHCHGIVTRRFLEWAYWLSTSHQIAQATWISLGSGATLSFENEANLSSFFFFGKR